MAKGAILLGDQHSSISGDADQSADAGTSAGSAFGSRARRVQAWLAGRADTRLGRLALLWFRRYFEASHNSGCAATVYSSLSLVPAALVIASLFHSSAADSTVYADRLISHLRLTGSTATLVHATFGSASSNRLAASITVVVSALLWGIGIGQIYQDVYARAWRLKVGSVVDQGLFAIFFFVLAGCLALYAVAAEQLQNHRLLLLIPAWLVASIVFWLWVPWFLLHRKVSLGALLPGAVLASIVLGGTMAFSPLILAAPLNANGRAFSYLGVVLTLVGYVFIMITLSLVCAVFSPVWVDWRQSERAARIAAQSQPDPGAVAGDKPV